MLKRIDGAPAKMAEPKWLTVAHVALSGIPAAWIDITAKEYLFAGFETPVHSLKVASTDGDVLIRYRGFDGHEETTERYSVSELGLVEIWTIEGRYAIWPKLLPLFPLGEKR